MKNEYSHAHLFSWNWTHRGYVPHFQGAAIQFISYRLSDSLPRSVIEKIQYWLQFSDPSERSRVKFRKIEKYLHSGFGCCVLEHEACAQIVIDAWKYFDGERYDLLEWVVMPNHIHVIIRVYSGWELHQIIQSWKSFTSKTILELVGDEVFESRRVWQAGYFDRIIRDSEHFDRAAHYVRDNPRKAGLVENPSDWRWSSAFE